MISGNTPKTPTSAGRLPDIREDRLQRNGVSNYIPASDLSSFGFPAAEAILERKASAMEQTFRTPAVYRQRALQVINSAITAPGASRALPNFIETTSDITPHLTHLRASSRGRHIIRLIEALCESVEIAHEKKRPIPGSHKYLHALLQLALEANSCESDIEAISTINIWCCQQLPKLLGVNFTNSKFIKSLKLIFLIATKTTCLTTCCLQSKRLMPAR